MRTNFLIIIIIFSFVFNACRKRTNDTSQLQFFTVDTFSNKIISEIELKLNVGYKHKFNKNKINWVSYSAKSNVSGVTTFDLLEENPDTLSIYFDQSGFYSKVFRMGCSKINENGILKYKLALVPKYEIPFRIIFEFPTMEGPRHERLYLGNLCYPSKIPLSLTKPKISDSSDVYYEKNERKNEYCTYSVLYTLESGTFEPDYVNVSSTKTFALYPGRINRLVIKRTR
jgi:hypothetical protein